MHLTCTNMPRESLKSALDKARVYDNAARFGMLTFRR